MIAALSLEKFGNKGRYADYMGYDKSNPWVAKIFALDEEHQFKRKFLRGQTDYSTASGTGARGIYIHYMLTNGLYEVNERTSWKHVRRYFVRAKNGELEEISRREVFQCLSED